MRAPTHYLIPADLTDDQVIAFCAAWNIHAPDVRRFAATLCRVAGTPADATMPVVGMRCRDLRSISTSAWSYCGDTESDSPGERELLVREADALSKIVRLEAEKAEEIEISNMRGEAFEKVTADCAYEHGKCQDAEAEIARLRNVLASLGEHIDCGCSPCMGQCWDKDSLREELAERANTARAALIGSSS